MDLLDADLDQINLELEDDAPSSRFGRIKKGRSGKRKRKQSTSPAKAAEDGAASAPNSAPSSPENAEEVTAAAAAQAAAVAAGAAKAIAEADDDADDELDDEYDEIELDDEEAAQRVAYEVDQVGDEDDEDEAMEAAAEKDEEYEAEDGDSDDSENEEVRHRVKKSKGDYGSDDEANAKKDAKKAKRAPATTKERMLQLRQENQRLRKSVPIDFGERKEEEGAKISLFNLLDDLKKKQPQKEVEEVEEEDDQDTEEIALLDKMVDMCETVAAPTMDSQEEELEGAEDEDDAEAEKSDAEDKDDAEADAAATEEEPAAAPSADDEPVVSNATGEFDINWLGGELNLKLEAAVRVQGLKGAPEHNGKEARVEQYHPDMQGTARYTVRLLGGDLRLHVRPSNLEILDNSDTAENAPAAAAAGTTEDTAPPASPPAASITDDVKARIEKNRQIAMAKREARRLSQQQQQSASADGSMGAFFQSPVPAAASLNYDVPAASPASPAAAPDPIAAELSFEEELAAAVAAAEAQMPAAPAASQEEEPASQEEEPASLPVDEVSEPQDPDEATASDMQTDDGSSEKAAATADAAAAQDGGEQAEDAAAAAAPPAAEEEEEEEKPDFIVADEWEGEKDGYYFGTGKEGPGYMLDSNAPGDVVPPFQTSVLTETLTKWVLGGGEEPDAEKVKVLEPCGWLQAGAEGGFETELTREQFRAVGAALRAVRSSASQQEEEEEATQAEDEEEDEPHTDDEQNAEEKSGMSAEERAEAEQVELEMELDLEDAKTGQKWSPFQPKANSRQKLRAQVQEKIFLKRAERARRMKELGLVPDHNNEMGPSMEPEDQDDDYAPEDTFQDEQREQENDQAIDDMLQDDLAEVEEDAVPVDPEADEADYETVVDETQPMDDEDEEPPAVELTEEEKAAKAEADALEAKRAEEERQKRLEQEAKEMERAAIQRRKEQILELRKMALDDRAARKANRHNARNGLFEAEADESGSDFSDDDDEESAERQAIEELRGIDYLAAADSDDENTEAHRSMLAKQLEGDMDSYLKQRGDVFDDDGKIVRHGRAMRKLLKKQQEEPDEDAIAQQLANQSSDSSESSDSDSDDDKPHNPGAAAAAAAAAAGGDGLAAASEDGGAGRAFAFASKGVGEAAAEPNLGAAAAAAGGGGAAGEDGLTEKQRKKARKKNIKRMRRAELARSRSSASVGPVDVKEMEEEVTNMIAPVFSASSRSQFSNAPASVRGAGPAGFGGASIAADDAPRRRPMLQRRNTYTRDASALDSGASQSGASAFGSITAGVSKGFFTTQQKKPESGGSATTAGSSMDAAGMGGSDLNEKGEAVVAAADTSGFTPFSGASLKRTKSFGGGAAAAVRANLRRQQSLKQGRTVGLLDALGGSTLSRAATIG